MCPYDLSIIIPAYNEEKRLPRTLRAVIDFLQVQVYTSEIIVTTDGSKDRTCEVAESFVNDFSNLRVISFPANRGKGFAVKAGMLAAKGRYRLFMDADYAVPVDYLCQFMRLAQEGNDIVIGSRAVAGAQIQAQQKFPRRQLALAFGALQWTILRLPFADTQCGFKLFTAEAAERLFPLLQYECAYFDAELLYLAHNTGAKISQVPVSWTHDQETRLPIGPRRSVDLFLKLLNIRKIHARKELRRRWIESCRNAKLAQEASATYSRTARD